jgi:Signal transduction histidine kinase
MRGRIKSAAQRFLDPEIQLQDRLFQLLSAIALAEFILVSAYTIVSGGSAGHIAVMLAGTALFTGTVAFTFRSGKRRAGAAISGLLYFLMYPLTFFSSGGMYGGAPAVFAFAMVYVFLATQKWERAVTMTVCVLGSGACFLASYLHPELLTRHTVPEEHAESFLSVLLVTLLLCTLFAFVTEVYRTENRIVQKQKKEIEELNRAQKRFFSSMSHEIRTPVNAIIGFNEMTLREQTSDEVRDNAQNIEVASKILLHTVNEILDMSKLETGGLEIVRSNYRTTAMLSDIVNMVWLRAQEKGLGFIIRPDPDLPTVLNGDEVRIKQILLNVVTNAVKYTKTGSVTLGIHGIRGENGGIRMVYEVTDTGIGIREENIPYLFTAFQRMDEQANHAIEGTGLGLSIVKQLLDLMDGTVTVESEYGKGSTFRIEIPQQIADEKPIGEVDLHRTPRAAAVKAESKFEAPGLKILAVDDTPMNLMVLRKLLRDTKAALDTVSSGMEALQKTAETHYDVIFMDHQMPEMDGIECLHRIREQQDGRSRDSKIVCLTANAGAEMEQQYREEGFDGYLMKPVRGKTLEAELARLTGKQ